MQNRSGFLVAALALGLSSCGGATPVSRAPAVASSTGASVPAEDDGARMSRLLEFAQSHGLPAEGIAERARGGANSDAGEGGLPADVEARLRVELLNGAIPGSARPEDFRAMEAAAPDAEMESLAPLHPEYEELRKWLAVYRRKAEEGGWPLLPRDPGITVRPGDEGEIVGRLRARLASSVDPVEADLARRGPIQTVYDADLEAAVRRVQQRLGVPVDGVVGDHTWQALSVPVEERVTALAASMEWFRWLPHDFGADLTLWVNLPTFELQAVEDHQVHLEMPVVVGARHTPTVLLVDTLERIVTNPYWNVPESIVIGELAPAQREDPGYLQDRDYEVVGPGGEVVPVGSLSWEDPRAWLGSYRVRQRPGPTNALGTIKFLFPNRDAIYMHDTPTKSTFERAFRAASHGCVRLADPWSLAEFLAERGVVDQDPTQVRASSEPRTLESRRTVQVVFTYLTARAGPGDGAPRFAPPLYEAHEPRRLLADLE